jgi:hypothetical protein
MVNEEYNLDPFDSKKFFARLLKINIEQYNVKFSNINSDWINDNIVESNGIPTFS